jgi:hypothetical protein
MSPHHASREPSMPFLTELENHLLGQPGYRYGAPSGAVPPTQECEMCRLDFVSQLSHIRRQFVTETRYASPN